MTRNPILITNGKVLIAKSLVETDILIESGKFKKFGTHLEANLDNLEIINASGKIVFPGIIDCHTHFALQQGSYKTTDDFSSGSKSALFGGVVFFIDYTMQIKGETIQDSIDRRLNEAENNSYIDYSFHLGITDWKESTYTEALNLSNSGFPSFKMFLIYGDKGWLSEDSAIFDALSRLSTKGAIIEVHCENEAIIKLLTQRLVKDNHITVKYHPLSRPNFVEGEAINRMVYLNRFAKGKLYIVHISSLLGAEIIKNAKSNGINVFAETCPQYLTLNQEVFTGQSPELFATCPPVRSEDDIKTLWQMIDEEIFDVIATDHCAFSKAQKAEGKNDFRTMAFGIPGVEYSFPIIFTEGHLKRKIELYKIAKVMCENPARIFGLIGRGKLNEGYNADLFIFDPEKKHILSSKTQQHPSDYCPYEGKEVYGVPETVIANGEVKIKDFKLLGKKNGEFTKRFINTN